MRVGEGVPAHCKGPVGDTRCSILSQARGPGILLIPAALSSFVIYGVGTSMGNAGMSSDERFTRAQVRGRVACGIDGAASSNPYESNPIP